jgi:hypothetical protein
MNTPSFSEGARSAKSHFEYTDWKEKMARIGHVAKGAVYGIAGVLTFMAAFNMGGQKAGKLQVIEFLQQQPFGKVLIILMAIGLACYAFYRFLQVTGKSERLQRESEGKRKALKAGYAVSGLIYLALAVYAVMQITGGSSGGSSSQKQQGMLVQLMQNDWGIVLIYIVAALLLIKAIAQFVKVANDDYFKDVRPMNIGIEKARSMVKKAGAAGFIARGILIAITAYFFYKAASEHDPSEIQGQQGAFSFLQDMSSGPWLMGAVALGLIAYAVYLFIVARYKTFHIR